MNYFDWIKFHCFGPDIENWFGLNLCFVYENIQANEKIKTNAYSFFPPPPGNPVVKPSPSNAGGAGLIPGWGARSHMPWCQKPKT